MGVTHDILVLSKRKGDSEMGQTDKQFNGFLRVIIRDLKEAISETDPDKKKEKLEALLNDLQSTLED